MKTKIFFIVMTAATLMSCYRDKGNYEYETINYISIDLGNNGFHTIALSETLTIDPILTFSEKEENNLEFRWYCSNEEISQSRNLSVPVKDLQAMAPRPYLKFKVTNLRDGSTFITGFYLEIVSPYFHGWLVLSKKQGRSMLSFINPATYEIDADLFTTLTGTDLSPNAIEVKEHWSGGWSFQGPAGSILVIQQDESGSVDISGNDMFPLYRVNDFFLNGTPPVDFRPVGEYYTWNSSLTIDDNGNVYMRQMPNGMSQSGVYPNIPIYLDGNAKIAKGWDGCWMNSFVPLYDRDNGRLFAANSWSFYIQPLRFKNETEYPYDPDDPNITHIDRMDRELIYVKATTPNQQNACEFVLVYKGTGGTYRVQEIKFARNGDLAEVRFMGESDFGDHNITDRSVFYRLERRGYLFYTGGANNNVLYMYDHAQKSSVVYYTFSAPIVSMCSFQAAFNYNDVPDDQKYILMVGLDNEEFHFLGTNYNHMTNPETRFIKKLETQLGTPVSTIFKSGWNYAQM